VFEHLNLLGQPHKVEKMMASLPSAWEDGEANREEYYARGICSFVPMVPWLLSILQHPLGSCMLLHNPTSLRLCYGAPVYALQPDITDNLTSLRATDSLFGTSLSHNLYSCTSGQLQAQ
jgi:hypothetical protein